MTSQKKIINMIMLFFIIERIPDNYTFNFISRPPAPQRCRNGGLVIETAPYILYSEDSERMNPGMGKPSQGDHPAFGVNQDFFCGAW